MKYLKRMKIFGFKKFEKLTVDFNEGKNIIVGDNEEGKSTILEAIDLVLSQKYKNYDKYIIKELLNANMITRFKENPSIETLPKINIELELELDNLPRNGIFYGSNHKFENGKMLFGIYFKCEIPEEDVTELLEIIENGKIPYEYYQMSWSTFGGEVYNSLKKPLSFMLIDNDNIDTNNTYNYYNKTLFRSSHESIQQQKIKNDFRNYMNELFNKLELNSVNEHQKFGVNEKKIIFENIISILDDDIPIENKGKGKENLIKTKIALDKKAGKMDVVAIEEPENHLSFPNLKKMLEEISSHTEKQLIITTHESMIASGLDLKNVMWVKEDKIESLKNLTEEDSKFFLKIAQNNLLQFILSEKVILVEGPTEFLLIPKIFEKIYNEKLDAYKITIISCSGISYKRYLDIADKMNKRIAVLTDNDKKQNNIEYKNHFNEQHKNIKIFMDDNVENWTWEKCFYNLNKEFLDKIIKIDPKADYLYYGNEHGKVLGKMLNNKTETAYLMYNENFDFKVPEYIKGALAWIKD